MKLLEWVAIHERIGRASLETKSENLKKLLKPYLGGKPLYAIPDFDTFSREGEPVQQNTLYTDENLHSFALNYTKDGNLYSIDFWKDEKTPSPVATLYTQGRSEEEIAHMIPEISKNPTKNHNLKMLFSSKKRVLEENENDPNLFMRKPKAVDELDPDVKAAEKLLGDDYDYSDPETVFEDLKRYVDMVIKGSLPSLLVTGSPGVGKTFMITSQLKNAGLKKDEDYLHVKGRSTAAGMFITLYENNGKIVLFDDCDSVFKSEDAVNILKGALDSYDEREISWLVGRPLKSQDGSPIPKQFTFTGKVIFISNLPQKKIDDAVKSRSFVLEVALKPEDMLKKMRKELPKVLPDVPLPLKEEALSLIEDVSSSAKSLELNMRTLIKAIKILKDVEVLDVAERLILQQCSYE